MTYIYDILLNFNKEFVDFFDWNKNDRILHIKKIPIYMVDTKTLKDVLNNEVVFDKEFLELIKDKTEVFYKHEIGKISYVCLFCSNEKIIALNIDSSGKVLGYSDLLVDEYTELFETLDVKNSINVKYNVLESKKIENFKIRNDKMKEGFILKTLNKLTDEQLEYIYYEMFIKNEKSRKKILSELYKLENIDELYNLIKCITEKYKKIK